MARCVLWRGWQPEVAKASHGSRLSDEHARRMDSHVSSISQSVRVKLGLARIDGRHPTRGHEKRFDGELKSITNASSGQAWLGSRSGRHTGSAR
jgi:hypothetical protein